ncbi:hypothetical protein AB0H36_05105 [Kribbella sp. NPDC050820]|uniref:hypothetical protein n=1 Tax=Kribbella sp. NPDC050820 TaxID=3155408 RepID=UPI0033F0E495
MARKFDYPIVVADLTERVAPGTTIDPGLLGYLAVRPVADDPEGSIQIWAAIRPEADFDTFAEWADQRVERFMEYGADADGWFEQSDGKLAVWARLHDMPPLD